MDGINDNHGPYGDGSQAHALALSRLSLFLPSLVIAGGYGGLWLWLMAEGEGSSALARLCLAVVLVGVPLMAAQAALRLATFSMRVMVHGVHLQPGFPSARQADIPFSAIRSLDVKRGPGGWMTGAGTLVLHLSTGESLAARGIRDADVAKTLVEAAARARHQAIGEDRPVFSDAHLKMRNRA